MIKEQKQKCIAAIEAAKKLLKLQTQTENEEKLLQQQQKELQEWMQRNEHRQKEANKWAEELRLQKQKLDQKAQNLDQGKISQKKEHL